MNIHCTYNIRIVRLLNAISEKKGEIKAYFLNQLQPYDWEGYKSQLVYASLVLEDSFLKKELVNAILMDTPCRCAESTIKSVKNFYRIYDHIHSYNPYSQESFKQANKDLLIGIQATEGYRNETVPFLSGRDGFSLSISAEEMNTGIEELFHFLRYGGDSLLIKSCLCHYAIQYYQPFAYENEKMSRLWHRLLLIKDHLPFEFIPWEQEILRKKKTYRYRLPAKDRNLDATDFVTFMLELINQSFIYILQNCRKKVTALDRIRYFYMLHKTHFTRKDYMLVHKNISSATASRDLDFGAELGYFDQFGEKNQTYYSCARR